MKMLKKEKKSTVIKKEKPYKHRLAMPSLSWNACFYFSFCSFYHTGFHYKNCGKKKRSLTAMSFNQLFLKQTIGSDFSVFLFLPITGRGKKKKMFPNEEAYFLPLQHFACTLPSLLLHSLRNLFSLY